MKDINYIPYREIAGKLDLEKGSVLWLAADLTRLAFMASRKEGEFNAVRFIDSFRESIGKDGTLVIPSFNYNLGSGDHYSPARTLPVTGALALEAMRSGGFTRTRNPLHSFLACGKEAPALAGLNNKSSFGQDSPFGFLHSYQAKMAILGTSIANAFTFVHYVEELNQVRYRKYKRINIYDEDSGLWGEFTLYAKKRGWTMDMSGLEKMLVGSGAAKIGEINGIPFAIIDLAASFPVVQEDIQHNHARNIARFSSKLYLRELGKSILGLIGFRTASDKISHDPGLL